MSERLNPNCNGGGKNFEHPEFSLHLSPFAASYHTSLPAVQTNWTPIVLPGISYRPLICWLPDDYTARVLMMIVDCPAYLFCSLIHLRILNICCFYLLKTVHRCHQPLSLHWGRGAFFLPFLESSIQIHYILHTIYSVYHVKVKIYDLCMNLWH